MTDINKIVQSTTKAEEVLGLNLRNIEANRELIELDGRANYFKLRSHWSSFIIFWITFSLISQFTLVFLIGCSAISLNNHQWFVGVVVGKNLVEILGMGVLVSKYLFKD